LFKRKKKNGGKMFSGGEFEVINTYNSESKASLKITLVT
jgi:hypothetical protein